MPVEINHTPGPWEVHEALHHDGEFLASIGYLGRGPITDIVGAEGNHARWYIPVAGMKYLVTPVEEQRANAHLIAAAPELLEALKWIIGELPISRNWLDPNCERVCKAAIAKAEGK